MNWWAVGRSVGRSIGRAARACRIRSANNIFCIVLSDGFIRHICFLCHFIIRVASPKLGRAALSSQSHKNSRRVKRRFIHEPPVKRPIRSFVLISFFSLSLQFDRQACELASWSVGRSVRPSVVRLLRPTAGRLLNMLLLDVDLPSVETK